MAKISRCLRLTMPLLVFFLFALMVAPSVLAAAAPAGSGGVDTGLQKTAQTAYGSAALTTDLSVIVGTFIKSAISLVGVIFMLLVVYGGFLWMTAGGAEEKVKKARDMIVSAVIGLIIIAAGYAITDFVINAISAATTGQATQ